MINVSLNWITEQVNGELINPADIEVSRVTIDSRDVQPGDLFIAIEGPKFDGHDYAAQAIEDGASAIITSHRLNVDAPQILVADTRYALGLLAAAVKAATQVKTIAITGSSGKTTVREMCASILRCKGNVLATKGNFNNDIGVPLTLLNLTHEDDFAVIELGANHRGEIAYTTALTRPDVALINNVSPAHVEGFGNIWGVARAKSEIAKGLTENGTLITNKDSEFAEFWQGEFANRLHKTFSVHDESADIRTSNIQLDDQGCASFVLHAGEQQIAVQVPLPGYHNVANALAASALCLELGVDIQDVATGLASLAAVPGRMHVQRVSERLRIIDDTYNANVGSAKAALDVLASFSGYRVMVLGDMGELGAHAREYHSDVGAHGIEVGINNLFTLGVLSESASQTFNGHGGQHFDNQDALINALDTMIKKENDLTILVKGSRSARMERIVQALVSRAGHVEGCATC